MNDIIPFLGLQATSNSHLESASTIISWIVAIGSFAVAVFTAVSNYRIELFKTQTEKELKDLDHSHVEKIEQLRATLTKENSIFIRDLDELQKRRTDIYQAVLEERINLMRGLFEQVVRMENQLSFLHKDGSAFTEEEDWEVFAKKSMTSLFDLSNEFTIFKSYMFDREVLSIVRSIQQVYYEGMDLLPSGYKDKTLPEKRKIMASFANYVLPNLSSYRDKLEEIMRKFFLVE